MNWLTTANLNARIEHAVFRKTQEQAFLSRFPPLPTQTTDMLPPISWAQIERQLRNLAGPDFERAMLEIEILRGRARTAPPEMFYRDLLTLAWSLIEEATPPLTREGVMD